MAKVLKKKGQAAIAGKDFVASLQKRLKANSQQAAAKLLGMAQQQLSTLNNKVSLSQTDLAGQVIRQQKRVAAMQKREPSWEAIFKLLKVKSGSTSDAQLALKLGVSVPTIISRRGSFVTDTDVSKAIASAAQIAEREAHAKAFAPVIEFFPIDRWDKAPPRDVLDTAALNTKLRKGLVEQLKVTFGIYIFYDALGRALYVGQAKEQSLWDELNQAFNRKRNSQTILVVKHPTNNIRYLPASEKLRQPVTTARKLIDVAAYFSAYSVADLLIDNFEALLIRALPNDLLNYKIEKIRRRSKKASTDKAKARKAKGSAAKKTKPAAKRKTGRR